MSRLVLISLIIGSKAYLYLRTNYFEGLIEINYIYHQLFGILYFLIVY
jgi:hypothetical protein